MDCRQAIVCVDDEAIILMAMKRELAHGLNDRFLMASAPNAQAALDLIDTLYAGGNPVALVLTDWLMPGIKGDELVAIIKERHPGIHCILVSGQVDAKAVAQAGLGGALDAFIEKPWRGDRLLATVIGCVDDFDAGVGRQPG